MWYRFDILFHLCCKTFSTKSSSNILCDLMPVRRLFGSAKSRKSRMKDEGCIHPILPTLDFNTAMKTTEASSVQNSSSERISIVHPRSRFNLAMSWLMLTCVRSRSFPVLSTDDDRQLFLLSLYFERSENSTGTFVPVQRQINWYYQVCARHFAHINNVTYV